MTAPLRVLGQHLQGLPAPAEPGPSRSSSRDLEVTFPLLPGETAVIALGVAAAGV